MRVPTTWQLTPVCRELPLQRVAAGGWLHSKPHWMVAASGLSSCTNRWIASCLLASCHVTGTCSCPDQHRDVDILLVRVEADGRDSVFHDRVLSRWLWCCRALTRYLVA